ncbi:MAG: 3-oxoacyl-[acyl-carrier protein] reductase, partial [Acidobacteriaceae bacterium]|nr:3-oxoacyl-[acyl-carrier protein] reductase [Acidobacteriaceae bacterium]
MSLAGKVDLITGGSRGIGAATVRLFRQAGAKVVFSYLSAAQQAETLVQEFGGPAFCRAIQQPLFTPEDGQA